MHYSLRIHLQDTKNVVRYVLLKPLAGRIQIRT